MKDKNLDPNSSPSMPVAAVSKKNVVCNQHSPVHYRSKIRKHGTIHHYCMKRKVLLPVIKEYVVRDALTRKPIRRRYKVYETSTKLCHSKMRTENLKKKYNSSVSETVNDKKMSKVCSDENGKVSNIDQSNVSSSFCHFIVGERKEFIAVNKFLLSMNSKVFDRMIFGELKSEQSIEIPDCNADAFRTMIEFINERNIWFVNSDHAAKVLYIAEKYDLPKLKTYCVEYLYPSNIDEMWMALVCGSLYSNKLLTDAAINLARQHSPEVLSSNHLLLLPSTALELLIQDDFLGTASELEVFQVVMYWAKHQCYEAGKETTRSNLREILKDVIKHVRFLLMSKVELVTVACEVLTDEEIKSLLTCYEKREEIGSLKGLCSSLQKRKRCQRGHANIPGSIYLNLAHPGHDSHITSKIHTFSFETLSNIALISVTFRARVPTNTSDKTYLENVNVSLMENGIPKGIGFFIGKVSFHDKITVTLKATSGCTYPVVRSRRQYSLVLTPNVLEETCYHYNNCDAAEKIFSLTSKNSWITGFCFEDRPI